MVTGLLGENSLGISLDDRTSVVVALATAASMRDEGGIRQAVADALSAGISNNEILDIMTVAARIQQSISLNHILMGMQGGSPAATPSTLTAAGTPRRRRGRPPGSGRTRAQQAAETSAPQEPQVAPTPEPEPDDVPAAFSSRDDFWSQLVASFQARMPDARLSRTEGPRERIVRMGRGRIGLNWAFRRQGRFAIQIILNNETVDSPDLEGIRQAVADYTGETVELEGRGANHATVAIYGPEREREMTQSSVDWGAVTMGRIYEVLRSIEGRRRRRGRRRRQPDEGTVEARLLEKLGVYVARASAE